MKGLKILCLYLFVCGCLCGCGQKTTAESPEEEETVAIPLNQIKRSGAHSFLIKAVGDAQISLLSYNKGEWKINVYIPISNTQTCSQWRAALSHEGDYDAAMNGIQVRFLDAEGKFIECELEHNADNIENLLFAESIVTETFSIQSHTTGHYREMKSIFDQIKGIAITHMDLDVLEPSSEMQSLGEDANQIDFKGIHDAAYQEYDAAVKKQ